MRPRLNFTPAVDVNVTLAVPRFRDLGRGASGAASIWRLRPFPEQLPSTGTPFGDDKAALFPADYSRWQRLRSSVTRTADVRGHSDLEANWARPEQGHVVERRFFIDVAPL